MSSTAIRIEPSTAALPVPLARGSLRCVWSLGARLAEGACWSPSLQALYFVDILGCQLHRYTPATEQCESWTFDEEISAVAECIDGRHLLVSLRHDLALFEPTTGALERLHSPEPGRTGNRFNDGKCDPLGRFWAGSTDYACEAATGALYRYDGGDHCVRHLDQVLIANGPTWSADHRTMFFNETGLGRTWAIDFDPATGTLGERRLWLQHDKADGDPDGMTTDADGRIWIARWGSGLVTCHDGEGGLLGKIELPTEHVTSCAFGGPDLRTLYITTATEGLDNDQRAAQPMAGGLFAMDLNVAGVAPTPFAG